MSGCWQQGWGGGLFTTGYGTHATYGADTYRLFASGFNGTSSGTPVVTSAAAPLQSLATKILLMSCGAFS